jgi:RHS repeat-associated protein
VRQRLHLRRSDAPFPVTYHPGQNKNYSYDANGNMLNRGTQSMTWTVDNRVASIAILGGGTANMEYDYTGMRVIKNASSTGMTLFPFPDYEIASNGEITKFICIGHRNRRLKEGDEQIFLPQRSPGRRRRHHRHQRRASATERVWVWGGISRSEGTVDATHRFTGQDLDPETGVYYYGGRYYDFETCKFVSPDPFVQDIYDPQNLNRYTYVVNNPQNYIDPDGYFHQVKKKKGGFFSKLFGWAFTGFLWHHHLVTGDFLGLFTRQFVPKPVRRAQAIADRVAVQVVLTLTGYPVLGAAAGAALYTPKWEETL